MKKNTNYKKYLPLFILLVVAVFLFFNLKITLPTSQKSGQLSAMGNLTTLKIFLDKGKVRTFQGEINSKTTLLDVLYFVSLKGVEFKYTIDKNNLATLMSFAGLKNIGLKTWHFYINGKLIKTEDLVKTIIKPGDLIEAKLE